MSYRYFTAAVLLTLGSCKTATVEGLVPAEAFAERHVLPSLEIVIAPGVEKVFPKSSYFAGVAPSSGAMLTPVTTPSGAFIISTPIHNAGVPAGPVRHPLMHRVATASFERHLGAVFSAEPARPGVKLVCDVLKSDVSFGWPLLIPTALSIGVLNLLGMPGNYFSASVDVRVELQEADGTMIAAYAASGDGTAFTGLYFNYSAGTTASSAHVADPFEHTHASIAAKAYALADALEDIVERIESDRYVLRPKLAR